MAVTRIDVLDKAYLLNRKSVKLQNMINDGWFLAVRAGTYSILEKANGEGTFLEATLWGNIFFPHLDIRSVKQTLGIDVRNFSTYDDALGSSNIPM